MVFGFLKLLFAGFCNWLKVCTARLAGTGAARLAVAGAVVLAACVASWGQGYDGSRVRWHDEGRDTVTINDFLARCEGAGLETPGERVAFLGRLFVGRPYVAHTLEGDVELLTVNVDEVDCTTFVESVLALAKTVGEGRGSWRDFVFNLEQLRYRGGVMDGYGSRLHYICDWVMDNSYRGNVRDVTEDFGSVSYAVKSIDFMSAHRGSYAQLGDSAVYERIRAVEEGYRNHRFPYVKSRNLGRRDVRSCFRDGDVVALTTSVPGLDVSHLGIVVMGDEGEPHLLHASSSLGCVVVSDVPLAVFMKRNGSLTGVRVLRLK